MWVSYRRVLNKVDSHTCDTPESGFQCGVERSHFWGQYSPYYAVPSEIAPEVPQGCEVTFAQVLSRHGARDPTARKTAIYAELVDRIHERVEGEEAYDGACRFLRHYEYRLGADELTAFGRRQMVNSGIDFHRRYAGLAARVEAPFVRSAGQKRVVDSAVEWAEGFHQSRSHSQRRAQRRDDGGDGGRVEDAYPYDILIIPEGEEYNNTLSDELCTAFEEGPDGGQEAREAWLAIFAPPITERLNSERCLPGANLTDQDTIYMMDLCPYETVADSASDSGAGVDPSADSRRGGTRLSPFCDLFTPDEWRSYDYYQSLGKWYGYGSGHELAPTRGVGFANELVARLTEQPVEDRTSTNHTLDESAETFPLGARLYADFSHDNDMSGIYAALGLYNATAPLPDDARAGPGKTAGYSASWSVPFAGRMYVEKLGCAARGDGDEEFVRVLVNSRVVPLQNCGADDLGRCRLGDYIESLSFARGGGHWDQCFE